MTQFSTIGLIGRLDSESTQDSIKRLVDFLSYREIEVLLDEETSTVLPHATLPIVSRKVLSQRCDLIIVVGGDGSLLAAARAFAGTDLKILGINRGRLGFLTDIRPDEIEYKVEEVLEGQFVVEERFLLSSKLYRGETMIEQGLALNDVVIHPGKFIRMIEFELYIDDEFVYRQRSDGLIISSPTGSTAYALSGGGPIMHPNLDALALVPMNPHTLSSRPIVVNANSTIRLLICESNNLQPHVSCDGQIHVVSETGDFVEVSKSPKSIQLLHLNDHSFYETCRTKLGWASQTGNT